VIQLCSILDILSGNTGWVHDRSSTGNETCDLDNKDESMAHGGLKNIWLIGRGEKGFDMYSSEYLMLLKSAPKECSFPEL